MNEFKYPTFSAIESRIHAARLERSAALGKAIGNTLARVWFATGRLFGTVAGHAAELQAQTNASRHLAAQQQIVAPH